MNASKESRLTPIEICSLFQVDVALPDEVMGRYGIIGVSGTMSRELGNDPEALDMFLNVFSDSEVLLEFESEKEDWKFKLIKNGLLPVIHSRQGFPFYRVRFDKDGNYKFREMKFTNI